MTLGPAAYMGHPFYTIGHSTRSLAEFLELLLSAEVTVVADVRTVPRSRTNPQYNREVLPKALGASGVAYQHIAELGGLRGKSRDLPPSTNAFWRNEKLHNYADYAMGHHFHDGLSQLKQMGTTRRCAVMCAETVWWRCHRRIIADYLLMDGERVFHILGPGQVKQAHMTPAARLYSSGILAYPAVQ